MNNIYCIWCNHDLKDKFLTLDKHPSLHLIFSHNEVKNNIHFSTSIGSYSNISSAYLEDETVIKMACPFCNNKLNCNIECSWCHTELLKFATDDGFLYLCPKKGCQNHKLFRL